MKHLAFGLVVASMFLGCENPPPPKKDPGPATSVPAAKPPPPPPKAPPPPPMPPLTDELKDPTKSKLTAPATFKAKFDTTKGEFVIEVTRAWAPHGADRFYNMVKIGYFTDIAAFRAVKGFMVQFGIYGNPAVSKKWMDAKIPPDERTQSNTRGMLSYAMAGSPDTRSVQLFISYGDNSRLDKMDFAPIGKVVEGMEVVDSFFQGYGESTTREQGNIAQRGNAYLRQRYPKLDYIKTGVIVGDEPAAASASAKAGDPPAGDAPKPEAAPKAE